MPCNRILSRILCYFYAFFGSAVHNFWSDDPRGTKFCTDTQLIFLYWQINFRASTSSHSGTTNLLLRIFAVINTRVYILCVPSGFCTQPNKSGSRVCSHHGLHFARALYQWVTHVLPPRINLRLRYLSFTVAFLPLSCYSCVIYNEHCHLGHPGQNESKRQTMNFKEARW